MGHVFKLRSGKWAVRFDVPEHDGKRQQKQIGGFALKSDAERELVRLEAEILDGQYHRASDISVSEFMRIWLRDYVESNLAFKTQEFYSGLFRNHIEGHFERIQISKLRANQVEAFYRQLAKSGKLSDTSIHHCHKVLRTALNHAVRWGYIKSSPMSRVIAPKMPQASIQYWEADTISDALELFSGSAIEFHVQIALLTGLRIGEICALNEKSLDFDQGILHITHTAQRVTGKGIVFKEPKTKASKSLLPMTDSVSSILRQRIHSIKTNRIRYANIYDNQYRGYLSVREDGSFMTPSYVSGVFRETLQSQEEIPHIRFHDLRHSCASWLLYNGVDLKTIQEVLRHADFSTTANTYSHVSSKMKKAALDTLTLPESI
jgi:integrase